MPHSALNPRYLNNPTTSIDFQSILKRCMKCIDIWAQFVLSKGHLHVFFFVFWIPLEFTEIMKVGANIYLKRNRKVLYLSYSLATSQHTSTQSYNHLDMPALSLQEASN